MAVQNYTPLDDFLKTQAAPPTWAPSKESEPGIASEPLLPPEHIEQVHDDIAKQFAVKNDAIELPPEVKAIGVTVVNHQTEPHHIALPLSDDKVMQGLHAPVTSSFRWLAQLAMYILHKAHMTIKMIQGKAVQVQE